MIDYLPSPLDVPAVTGIDPKTDEELTRAADLDAPFSALAFKVMSDPFVGKLTYFRVYSGTLKSGDRVLNTTNGQDGARSAASSRCTRTTARSATRSARARSPRASASSRRRRATRSRSRRAPIVLERMTFPEPGDLGRDRAEDEGRPGQARAGPRSASPRRTRPSASRSDEETGQTLIAGMGELHLEIIVDRLMREFKVDANVGRPQVAYRETIGKPAEKVQGKFVRQTGGSGQYGDVDRSTCCRRSPAPATSSRTRSSAARSRRSTSSRSTRGSRRR